MQTKIKEVTNKISNPSGEALKKFGSAGGSLSIQIIMVNWKWSSAEMHSSILPMLAGNAKAVPPATSGSKKTNSIMVSVL